MLTTPCIVLVCGPPASLKSTLIRVLCLLFNNNHQQNLTLENVCVKFIHQLTLKKETKLKWNFLLFDNLFHEIESDIIENESSWKSYRSLIADEIERLIIPSTDILSSNLTHAHLILDRLHQSLSHSKDNSILVIEDNFYYASMRHRYRQISQRAQIGFVTLHLQCDLSIAIERNRRRHDGKRVSNSSMRAIYSKYEFSNDENRHTLVIDTSNQGLTVEHLSEIFRVVECACGDPEQRIDEEKNAERREIATEINRQNVIYQIDQRLRKFISNHIREKFSDGIQTKSADEKKTYAEMINQRRHHFLEMIKQQPPSKLTSTNSNEEIEQQFARFLGEELERFS